MRAAKPRLLILTSSFPRDPADETCGYVREFARSLSTEFHVTVLAPPDQGRSDCRCKEFKLVRSRALLPDRLNRYWGSKDLNQTGVTGVSSAFFLCVSITAFLFKAAILARTADVIVSHWLVPSGLAGAFLSRLYRTPHVAIEHSGALHLLRRMKGGALLAGRVVANSNLIVTVSSDLERKLIDLCPRAKEKTRVLPMGVRAHPVDELPEAGIEPVRNQGEKTLLFIGRLTQVKGVEYILRAVAGMQNLNLLVAGEGEQRHALEEQANRLQARVKFLGSVGATQKAELLKSCDAVVIPSVRLRGGRTEGLPVVCLEAMAAGRPVIASRTGGLPEVVTDQETGLLFEPGDAEMLREKIDRLFGDEALRLRLAANARTAASQYGWPRIGGQFAGLIKEAMRNHG